MRQRTRGTIAIVFVLLALLISVVCAQEVHPVASLPLILAYGMSEPSATPTRTATPTHTTIPTSTPTQTPIPVTLLPNGDFEQGAAVWEPQVNAEALITNDPPAPVTARSGAYVAGLPASQSDPAELDMLNVMVPLGEPYLGYWVWIRSTEPVCGDDVGGVAISSTVRDRFNLCAATQTNGWVKRSLDLSDYAGQSVTIILGAGTFDTTAVDSFLYVDDVGFQAVP